MTTARVRRHWIAPQYRHIVPLPEPEPVPDAMEQIDYVADTLVTLKNYFANRHDVLVSGEGYICFNTRDRRNWVVPDLWVALDVDVDLIRAYRGHVIDEVGKPPDLVLEVASQSTGRIDCTYKRDLYAMYRVPEYWRFDPTGGEYHDAPIACDRLVGDEYQPMEMTTNTDGVVWGHSDVLGLDLCWVDRQLRLFDPESDEYLRTYAEAQARGDEAEHEVRRLRQQLRSQGTD